MSPIWRIWKSVGTSLSVLTLIHGTSLATVVLPDPIYDAHFEQLQSETPPPGPLLAPGTISYTAIPSDPGIPVMQGNATISLLPNPTITVSTSFISNSNQPISDSGPAIVAGMQYAFAVVGPTSAVPVPIKFHASGAASAVGSSLAYGRVAVFDPSGTAVGGGPLATVCIGSTVCNSNSYGGLIAAFDLTAMFSVAPSDIDTGAFLVQMAAYSNASSVPGSASAATIDPWIEIDPSFPNAASYSLVFSTGFGNSPDINATPEPASLLILCGGTAGIAMLRRRRMRAISPRLVSI